MQTQNPIQALRSNQPLLDQEVIGTTQYIWRPQLSFIWQQPGDVDGDGTFDKTIIPKNPEAGKDSSTDPGVKREKWNYELYVEGKMVKSNSHIFIWTIQTLDDKGLPVTQTDGNGEARSEPILFIVDPNKNKPSGNSSKKKGPIKVIKDTTGGGGG